jgi:hypothetical protein
MNIQYLHRIIEHCLASFLSIYPVFPFSLNAGPRDGSKGPAGMEVLELELLPSVNFRNRLIVVNNRLIVLIINLNMTSPWHDLTGL